MGLPRQTISFKFFKGCLPQILVGLFLNTLPHLSDDTEYRKTNISEYFRGPHIFQFISRACRQYIEKVLVIVHEVNVR